MDIQIQKAPESLPALVDWPKAPTISDLKQDFQDAKPIHDAQVLKLQGYLDNLNITGSAKIRKPKNGSAIQPKLIRKLAEWRYPSLSEPFLSTPDIFKVKPVTWEDRAAAKQNQLLLNHQFNTKIDKVKFIDTYVRAAVDEGTVVLQTGWCFEDEEYEVEEPIVQFVINPEYEATHAELAQLKEMSPSQYDTDVPDELKQAHEMSVEQGVPIEPQITGYEKVKKRRVLKNHPTVEVCDLKNLVIDPTAQGDLQKAGFVIKSFETSKSALKASGKNYQNLDQISLDTNSILGRPDHEASAEAQTFNFKDDARKKFVAHEYWGKRDIDGNGLLTVIVATWVGDLLIRMEKSPFSDKELPFVSEHLLPVRDSNYGEPDGALLEDNQKVVGAVTRGMIDIMGKSANGQTGMRRDMLDSTNKRKFEAGQDYEFNQNVDPRMGVHMHTYPEIPQSAQFMLQLQNMDAESLIGVKSWSAGISGAALGDVAAAARGALDAASKRELGILRRLANGIVKVGRKFIAMNSELLSDEEVVRITNEEFVAVRRDDLSGAFDLELGISTAEEDANKADQLAFLLQTVGPDEDPEIRRMVLSDICRLRKMPDMAEKFENYKPEPNPVQQKLQELEIAKLEAEIAELQAKAAKTLADAGLAQAKVGTEAAKQSHLGSATDLANLDYVEQESGVKQERDKELVGEQARSQAQSKLIDREIAADKNKTELLKAYIAKKAK